MGTPMIDEARQVQRPPLSVVIPTIGRPECLQTCLESLAACDPRPDEVLVVDQSGGSAIKELVERFAASEVRAIPSASHGIAHAVNLGMREARNEQVAITHDDCSVAKDWVKVAARLIGADPEAIFSGQVLPGEGNGHVPSTIEDPEPREYSGVRLCDVLYPANMVCIRDGIFELGGFDERFALAAEDNDLCYRWLRAGRRIRYEPSLRVWHEDWRTPAQLRALYREYGRGQGTFYGKHLRRGDPTMLRFLLVNLMGLARSLASALLRRQTRAGDPGARLLAWPS